MLALVALAAACGDDGSTEPVGDGSPDASADGAVDGDDDGSADGDGTADGSGDGADGDTDGSSADGSDADGTADGNGDGEPACDPSAAPDLSGLSVEVVANGVNWLVHAAQAPGSDDWYLVEQGGVIRVWSDGALRSTAFLDLSGEMGFENDERGLLSIAFAPDYQDSGRFYVMGTPTSGANLNRDTVYGFTRSAADPYVADPSSREVVLRLPNSDVNHNGGTVAFGPDGMLYVGTGDGGGGCNNDKPDAPQDVSSPFGKILRLNPENPPTYAPAGNPFASSGDGLVWHYGLRNPFRFSFDRLVGDLYIGDVGQDTLEEISFASSGQSGLNFGWAAYEGSEMTCGGRELAQGAPHVAPIVEIPQVDGQLASVVGGVVYRGSALPKLRGAYLFTDYYSDHVSSIFRCASGVSEVALLRKRCDPNFAEPCLPAAANIQAVGAFVEDHAGEVYLAAPFQLLKLVPAP